MLYSEAVNTFRVITYLWDGEVFHVPLALRIGQGGSYLDNAHAGGMFIGVNDLYTPLAKKDTYRLNQVLNAIDHFYTVSGCLYTIAIAIIAGVLPFVLANQLQKKIRKRIRFEKSSDL